MLMRKHLRDYFIPHEGNEYRPHSLREESVFMFGAAAVLLFAGALLNTVIITRTNFYAAIIPSVLADYANSDRHTQGLGGLEWNPVLAAAAEEKVIDMAAKGYFAHTSPEGVTPWYWFQKAGYTYRFAGENLAVYFSDSSDVHWAWMNSPGHRANILNSSFTEIGIAIRNGMYQGRETVFVVELFGKPQEKPTHIAGTPEPVVPSTPAPNPTPTPAPAIVSSPSPSPVLGEEKQKQETFIAVEAGGEEEVASAPTPPARSYSSMFERVLTTPRENLRLSYFLLFAIIAIALLAGIGVEFRHRHPRHMVYGSALLLLLISLYYIGEAYVFSNVLII